MARFAAALAFFHPEIEALTFPAWDCLPYDRVSPNGEIVSRRIDTLTRLATAPTRQAAIVLTTVNALVQRVPPRRLFDGRVLTLGPGGRIALDRLQSFFRNNGYIRTDTVREPGEYAMRGGIVDLYPAGAAQPVRLDFFGDTLEMPARLRPADAALDRQARRGAYCARSARCCSTTPQSAASARATARRSARPAPTTRFTNRSAPGGGMPAWSTGCRSITSSWRPCSTTCRAPGSRSITRPRRRAATGSTRSPISTPRATTSPPAARARQRRFIARSSPTRCFSARANGRRLCAARPVVQLSPFAADRERRRRVRRRAPARRKTSPPSAPTRISCCSRRCAIISTPSRKPAAKPRSPPSAKARPTGSPTVLRERGVTELRRVADGRALETLPQLGRRTRPPAARAGLRDRRAGPARRAGHSRRPARAHAAPPPQPRRIHRRGGRACRRATSSSMPITASAATRGWRRSTSPARRMIA